MAGQPPPGPSLSSPPQPSSPARLALVIALGILAQEWAALPGWGLDTRPLWAVLSPGLPQPSLCVLPTRSDPQSLRKLGHPLSSHPSHVQHSWVQVPGPLESSNASGHRRASPW